MSMGAYGVMTFGLGLLAGLAVRHGARYVALLGLLLFAAPLYAGQPKAALRIVVPGVPGHRYIAGSAPLYLAGVRARLEDPNREYACPTTRWTFGDGCESGWEDTACSPGKFVLALEVRAQGRKLSASREVYVLGPGWDGPAQ